MYKTLATLCLAAATAACAMGQAQMEVTTTHNASFPGAKKPSSGVMPPSTTETASVTIDVSSTIASWGSYGTLSTVITQDELSGSGLGVIRHVDATIAPKDDPKNAKPMAAADVPARSSKVALVREIDDAELFALLRQGPVVLTFTIVGPLSTAPIVLEHTLAAQVDLSVSTSIPGA